MKRGARIAFLALCAAFLSAAPPLVSLARSHKQVEVPPPPPPPPPGPMGLPPAMVEDAAAYASWLEKTTAINPAFSSPADVSAALELASSFEPKALLRGAVAYGAIAALQSAQFVASVRAAGPTPDARATLINTIIEKPATVFAFAGAEQAAGYAEAALGGDGMRLYLTGGRVRQASYDVQRQAWSKVYVADPDGRLARAKAASETPPAPDPARSAVLTQAASGTASMGLSADAAKAPYTPLIARTLQLAAIAALGEASDQTYAQILDYLTFQQDTGQCLEMAKLNLFQCLAVARPNYEDIFCTGQHAIRDTGECLARGAGVIMPLELDTPEPLRIPPAVRHTAYHRHYSRRR